MSKLFNLVFAKGFLLTSLLFFSGELIASSSRYLLLEKKQPILLYEKEQPIATLVLFAGGKGYLQLQKDGTLKRLNNNFLIRSIPLFLKENFRVVVYETPLGKVGGQGLLGGYRLTEKHAHDVAIVIDYLRQHYSQPIWLVGTSRGSNSAANAVARLGDRVEGVVLSAPLTKKNKKGGHVLEVDLHAITVPVYLVSHQKDACWVTPPKGLQRIADGLIHSPKVGLKVIKDPISSNAKGRACGGLSAHGFIGVEAGVIHHISTFISKNSLF